MNAKRAWHLIDAHWSGFGDGPKFPTSKPCTACEGHGEWQTRSRRYDSPAEGYVCESCNGKGAHYSPECKAVRRERYTPAELKKLLADRHVNHSRNAA